jgi:beta-1,4-mannosyltransferase
VNVYVYPWSTRAAAGAVNPYLGDFIRSLEPHCTVVNRERRTSRGLFGVVPYLRQLDVLVLHWIENVPDRRGAAAQVALLHALLRSKRRLGVRVVYVLHNKVSHDPDRTAAKARVQRAMLERADLVLTLAGEGVRYATALCPSVAGRIHYLPHPMHAEPFTPGMQPFDQRPYDLLIWGRLAAYKGLTDFVEFLNANALQDRYRIKVAGSFTDRRASTTLAAAAPYLDIDDRVIPDAALRDLMAQSRIVLFPYRPDTVLGSSALMASLASDACIIGPHAGAFRDCADLGLISVFDRLADLPGAIDRALASDRTAMLDRRRAFAARYTWEWFGRTFASLIGG